MKSTNKISTFNKAIAYFMLSLVVSLLVNNFAYLHTHHVDGQTTITHAHPYKCANGELPSDSHSHKKYEYSVINLLQFFILVSSIIFTTNTTYNIIRYYVANTKKNISLNISQFLRGPPIPVL
jgi:hypothetical protein